MSHRLLEIVRRMVRDELASHRTSMLGVITSLFPHEAEDDDNNYEVHVRLKHEDLELRRVPLTVGYVGVAAPPRVGDLVMVQFINGDLNQPIITGRLYHDGERPPLHKADEVLFEHRLPDDTINHLRFTEKGTIYLQRDVKKTEDNSEAQTSVKIDGETGDVEIKTGTNILITLTNEGNAISITSDTVDITADVSIDGTLSVSGDTTIEGVTTIGTGPKTTIDGNEITGG